MIPKRHKYNAHRTTVDGIIFPSKREADYYLTLCEDMKRGKFHEFRRQVRFDLIPSQWEGAKCIERSVFYKADFVIYDAIGKVLRIIDCKGFKTPEYVIKRKLLRYMLGFAVEEV